jgi:hypothetical protein
VGPEIPFALPFRRRDHVPQPHDRQLLEQALARLVGRQMWGAHLAADMLTLQFGTRRLVSSRKGPREVGEYALHLQIPWRFLQQHRILLGSGDIRLARERVRPTLLRERLQSTLESSPHVVSEFEVDAAGGFLLRMENGNALSAFPDESDRLEDSEWWRLFVPGGAHFVVTSTGLSNSG